MALLRRLDDLLSQPRWLTGAMVLLMAMPAVMVTFASRLGPAMEPDSVVYVSVARSFASTGELTKFNGQPLTVFPPGLPIVLGAAQRAGLDVEATAVALNALCIGAGVLLSYLLARQAHLTPTGSMTVAAFFGLSYSTVWLYPWLMTEPLFTTLVLGMLVLLARAVNRRTISWWEVLAVAAAVSIATSIRFIGFILLPIVALGVFLATRSRGWRRAAPVAVIAAGLSASGLVAVAVRNFTLGEPALGDRWPSGLSLAQVLSDWVVTLGRYAYPTVDPSVGIHTFFGILLVVLLVYGFARALIARAEVVSLLGAFVAIYWSSLWYSEITTTIDPINFRLLLPVFTPMLIVAAYALRDLATRAAERSNDRGGEWPNRVMRAVSAGLVGLLMLVLALNVELSIRFVRYAAVRGLDYSSPEIVNSPLGLALKDLPPGGVAATDPYQAHWTSGRTPITQIPREGGQYWSPEDTAAALEDLRLYMGYTDIVYFAYFRSDTDAVTPEALAAVGIPLRLLASYPDGTLYEVVPHSESD